MASPPKLTGETLIVHHIPLVHCQVPAVRAQGIMGKRAAPFSLTSDLGSQGSVSLSGSRTNSSSSNSSSNNSNSSSNNSANNGDGGHVRGREKAGLSSPCSTAVASLPDGTAHVQDQDSPRLSGPCGAIVQNDPRRTQQSSFHLHNNKNRCMTRWRSLSSQLEGGCGVTIATDGQVTNTNSRARSQVTGNGRAGNRFNRASSCPDGHNGNNVRFKRLSLQCQGKGLSIVRDIDNADVGGYRSRSGLTNELLREAEEMLDNCNESGAEDDAPVEGFGIIGGGGGGTRRDPVGRGSRSARMHDNDDGGCDGDYGGDDVDCERNGYASLGDANYEYCENDGPHGGGCGGCGEYECSMCSTRISNGSARTELSDFGGEAPGGRRDVDKGSDGDVGQAPTGSSSSMQWSPLESESFYLDLHSSPCGSQRTGGGGGSSSSSPSEPFTVCVDRELRSASALDYDADADSDGNLRGTGDRAAVAPGGLGAGGGGGTGRAVEESAADDDDGLGVGRASAAAGGRDSPLPGASGSRGEARLVQAMQNYYRLVTVDLSTQSTPSHTAVCSSAESSASSEGPGGAAFGPVEASTEYYLFDRPRAGGEGATPVDEAGGRRSRTSPALARGRFGDVERDGGESPVGAQQQQQQPEEEASGRRAGAEASGKVAEREVAASDENPVLDSMDFASWAERFKTHPHERDDSLGEGLRCRESPKDPSLKNPTRDDESQMLELTTWSFRSKTSIESRQESLTDSPQSSNGAYREGEKDEDMPRGFDIRPYKHVCGLNTCHSFPRHITPSLRQRSKSYDQSLGRKPLQGIVSFNRLLSCPSELSQGPASQQATPQKRVTSFAKIAQSRKKGGGPSPPPPQPQCRHGDLASMQITPIDERSSLGHGPYDSAGSVCRVTDEAAGGALDGSAGVGRSLSRRSNPFQSEPNLPQSSGGGGKVPSSASFTLNGRAVPEYLQTWSPSPPYACPADNTTGGDGARSGGEEDGSGGGGGALPKGRREEAAARAGASAGTRGEVCGECADGQRRDADVMGASGGGRSWALREGHGTAGLGTNPCAKTTTPTQYGKEHRPTTLPIQPFILHHHLSRQLAARPVRPVRGAPQQPSAALPLARGQPQPPAWDPAGSGGPPPPASAAHGRSAPLGHPGGQLPLQISRPTLTGTRLAALGSSQSLGGSQSSRDVALQQSLGDDGGDGAARSAQQAADARDSGSDSDQWNSDGGAAPAALSVGTARQSLVCECRSRRRWRPPPGAIRPSPLGSLSPIRADLLLLASASPTRAAAGAAGAPLPPQPPPPPRSSSYPPTIATYSCGLALAGDSGAEQSPAGSSVPGRYSSSKPGGFLGDSVAAPAAFGASPKAGGSGGGVFGGETWRPQPLKRSPRFTSLQANSGALGPPQGHSQRAAAATARHLAETRWGCSEAPRPLRDGPAAERVGDGGRFHSSCANSRGSQGTLIQPASDLEVLWHGRRGCRSSSSPAVRCGSFPHRASSSWASRTRAHTQGPSARPLQAYYSDFCPDYFSMAERPPHEFCLSPDDSDSSTSIDLLEKRALVQTVNSAIDLIVAHFGTTRDAGVKAKLGDSSVSPNVGHLVLKYLCPALSNVLKDGLRPHLLDLIVGRRRNTPWSVVESSTQLGPSTKRLHGLYQHLCQLTELSSQSMRFNAFILGLLNMKSLDFWINYLHNHEGILTTHYLPEGFLAMPNGACAPLVDELVLLLQPLALLPFRLDERFEVASGEQQHEQIRQHERLRSQFENLQRSVHSTFQFMRNWSNATAAGAADATDAATVDAAAVPGEGVVGRTMNELAADTGVRGSDVSPDGGEDRVAAVGLSDRSEKDPEGFNPDQEQSLYSSCQEPRDDVVEGDVGRQKRSGVALRNVSALRDDAEIDKAPNQMVTCAECKHSASGVQSQEAEKPQEGGESSAEHSLVRNEEERASACSPAAVSNTQPTSSQWQSKNVDWWQQLKESSQIYLTAEREGGGPRFSRWNRPHSFTYVKAGEPPERLISKSAEPHKGHSPDGRNFAQGGKENLPTPDVFRVSREPTRKSGGQDYLKKTPPSDTVAGQKKRGWLGSPPDSDDLNKPPEEGQAVERRGGDVEAPPPPAALWLGRLFGASPHRQQQQQRNAKDVQTLRSPQINRLPSSWLGLDMSAFGLVTSLPVATETNQATPSPDNGGSVSAGATAGAQSLAARAAHEASPRERGSNESREDRVREVTALCHHAAADRGQPSVRRGDVPRATGAAVPGRLLCRAQGGQEGPAPAPGAAGFVSPVEDSEH